MFHIHIEGLDQLQHLFGRLPAEVVRVMTAAMGGAVEIIRKGVAKYPKSTEANKPGRWSVKTKKPMGYYERGKGWWYPVKRKATLGPKPKKSFGSLRAAKVIRETSPVVGYRLSIAESEVLGKSWTTKVSPISGGVRGTIGTRASYAPFVQDKIKQASLHAARGWPTVQEVLGKNAERIAKLFQAALRRILGR